MRISNPFHTEKAIKFSNYSAYEDGALSLLQREGKPSNLSIHIHNQLRELVLSDQYPCIGAKTAFKKNSYRFGLYPSLASSNASEGLAYDLFEFVAEQKQISGIFPTFIASFEDFSLNDEYKFENYLWSQLQKLHDLDSIHHSWDPAVSSNPKQPNFSFSFAQTAFFVVGLNPLASRWSRRFSWPTLVFNPHYVFEELRQEGKFTSIKNLIRKREIELQGSLNPNVNDFGEESEARQYSGRKVEPDWKSPLKINNPS